MHRGQRLLHALRPAVFEMAKVEADLVFNQGDHGVAKTRGQDFDQDDFVRLLPMLRQACKKLLSPAFVPPAAISGPCLTDFMRISG